MEFANDLKILLKETCIKLKENDIKFCLAGGWAVSILGIVRATVDIDILIILDDAVKKQVVAILKNSFNLIQSHEKEMEFKNITIWRNIVSLRGKTNPLMIDFMKAGNDYLKVGKCNLFYLFISFFKKSRMMLGRGEQEVIRWPVMG